jgi:hypothetical protein
MPFEENCLSGKVDEQNFARCVFIFEIDLVNTFETKGIERTNANL